MSVGPSHPRCFVVGGALWVVPSDSGHDVEATRRSHLEASRSGSGRPRLGDAWAYTGGVAGAFFMGTVAAAVWDVDGLLDLAAFALSGGLVGTVLAVGTKRLLVDAPVGLDAGARPASLRQVAATPVDSQLPAVVVPRDVARASPADASGDELAVWSRRSARWAEARAARAARVPGLDARPEGTVDPETEYEEARADYEPVARLLGLPLPR